MEAKWQTVRKVSVCMAALLLLCLLWPAVARCDESTRIVTLWPLLDYRASAAHEYSSLRLLGPLFKRERVGDEIEYGLRPLYFRARAQTSQISYGEFLYPVVSWRSQPEQSEFQTLRLLTSDFGPREKGSSNEFMLFPLVFYRAETEDQQGYLALFPLGGTLRDRFWRDEIHFTLFPLYSRTHRAETTTRNYLWPFVAHIEGPQEEGIKFWPLYGESARQGVYQRRFALWPLHFDYHLRQNTDNPLRQQALLPLYMREDSPERTQRFWLWPFFRHLQEHHRDYEEWNYPWPLWGHGVGTERQMVKRLPLYSEDRRPDSLRRWVLWPLWLETAIETPELERQRQRLLFFLFSNTTETVYDEQSRLRSSKRLTTLWPLYLHENKGGVSHLQVLALLEPFFSGSDGVRRNWSPLWSLYVRKWDQHDNEMSSLLWNLYWKERRGADLAMEMFPLFSYRREGEAQRDLKIFKGLVRYQRHDGQRRLSVLFLPWGLSWSGEEGEEQRP